MSSVMDVFEKVVKQEASWDPPEPADKEYVARVKALVREATVGAREAMRLARGPVPVPTAAPVPKARVERPVKVRPPKPVKPPAKVWTRGQAIAAMWVWAAEHDGVPPSSDAWMKVGPGRPSYFNVRDLFEGGWLKGLEAAGFDRPVRGRGKGVKPVVRRVRILPSVEPVDLLMSEQERELRDAGRCSKCGIGWDEQTEGCAACVSRHYARRINSFGTRRSRTCAGCGCDLDDLNQGCHNCRSRHKHRAQSPTQKLLRENEERRREVAQLAVSA